MIPRHLNLGLSEVLFYENGLDFALRTCVLHALLQQECDSRSKSLHYGFVS